jgi:RNA polymerase sigma factor (sigma-70 family)
MERKRFESRMNKEVRMNTQCAATISSAGATVNRAYRRREPGLAMASSRRGQNLAGGRVDAAAFDQFLCWLGPDPETAAQKYETIRGRLIMMFRARKCVFAEDLADVTFERVARKLTGLSAEFTGDPARYFYGVAKKIHLEYQRRLTAAPITHASAVAWNSEQSDSENRLDQLEEALDAISQSDRELILKYYAGSGQQKIDLRRALAEQSGIGPNALRLRVFRIRTQLKRYMLRRNYDLNRTCAEQK